MLYGPEIWSFRADIRRLSVIRQHKLHSIGKIRWENFHDNSEVECNVLDIGVRFPETGNEYGEIKMAGTCLAHAQIRTVSLWADI